MQNIKQLQTLVNKTIEEIQFISQPEELYKPIEYTITQGGKRIRPVLCLMAAKLFNSDISKIVIPAIALEVFHNFTLLHDDIMDNADVRRNMPTVHKKWNTNTAILSGDAMLIKAYQLISESDSQKLPEVIQLFNKVALGVCEGQQYDMEFEDRNDVTVDEYIEMIRLKTAILLAGSLKLGAILSNASEKDADHLYQFGINIGIAFQLQDDYLDSFGNQSTFGKKIGGDIVANKKTFLMLNAISEASGEDRKELNDWLSKDTFDANEKIKEVQNIYKKLSVDEASKNKMKEYYNLALENISSVNGSEDIKSELISYANSLMERIS